MIGNGSLTHTLNRMMSLNRALDEVFAGSLETRGRVWVPAMDVVERPDAYLIAIEVPGVDPATVDISFEHNVLTIRGTKPQGFALPENQDVRVFGAERVTGSFERSVRLPEFVDSEQISAEATHGLLLVTVPKAQSAQPRKILIRGVEPKQVNG